MQTHKDKHISLINVYAPNTDKDRKVCKLKAQNLRNEEFYLVDRLSILDDKIINEEISDLELEEYSTLKDLEYVEGIRADGARVRSRVEQVFFGQERETGPKLILKKNTIVLRDFMLIKT